MAYFKFDILCPTCGYNLRGLSLGRGCPECGLRIISMTPGDDSTARTRRIDAEIDANIRHETDDQLRDRVNQLVSEWESRGQRVDELLDRVEHLIETHAPERLIEDASLDQ